MRVRIPPYLHWKTKNINKTNTMKTSIKAINVKTTFKHLDLTGSFMMESCLNDLTYVRRAEFTLILVFIIIMLLIKFR